MLKIWLNWLQPSIGVFGTALAIANPLYTNAAPRPVSVSNASKTAALPTAWSSMRSSVATPTIDRDLLAGVGATPDMAVRQLAIDSIATSGVKSTVATATTRKPLASITNPSGRSKPLSAKASKTQTVKNSIAAALAPAAKAKANVNVLVPGLFIGTGDVRVADRFLPTVKPTARRAASTKTSAKPVTGSGMMVSSTIADPYPVVRPELMQKLEGTSVAVIPAMKTTPRVLAPIASTAARLPVVETTSSNDPIAGIPSGLQSLLGNSFNERPTIGTTPVAKTVTNKSNSLVALKQLISPTLETASVSVSAGSLQLATAQVYTNAPKFNIPGETILGAKPVIGLLTVKPVQKSLAVSTIGRKSNYVTLMTDRQLTSVTGQSWTVTNQKSNLGGLILGSQPLATLPKSVILGSTISLATRNFQ
jgi:hypothetical protein